MNPVDSNAWLSLASLLPFRPPPKKIVPLPKQSQNQSVFQADHFRPKSLKKKRKM